MFDHRRDLFTDLRLVFFDTTSIYFEGEGGQDIGQRGFSKDHRPDLYQMVVGAVLDGPGRPICCELWPGNTSDVTTLIPVVDRLRSRFGVRRVYIVADRGMISKETLAAFEQPERGWQYIRGARMRSQNEVKDEVLSRAGSYRVVHPPRVDSDDPSPLKVKEVWVDDRRYIVCLNDDEARKDAAGTRRSWRRCGGNSATETSRWSVKKGTAATSAAMTPLTSRSMRRRSPRTPAMTASGCSAPTPAGFRRCGVAVQTALDGGALVPVVQVTVADAPDLPQV